MMTADGCPQCGKAGAGDSHLDSSSTETIRQWNCFKALVKQPSDGVDSFAVMFTVMRRHGMTTESNGQALAQCLRNAIDHFGACPRVPAINEPRIGPGGQSLDCRVGGQWIDEFRFVENPEADNSDGEPGMLLFGDDARALIDVVRMAADQGFPLRTELVERLEHVAGVEL